MPLIPENSAGLGTSTTPTFVGTASSGGSGVDSRTLDFFPNNSSLTSINPVATGGFTFTGAGWDRLRTANVFKNLSALLITAEQTVWTPAGGKKFRLMGFVLTQGVLTGAITLRDNTAGTTILTIPQTTVGVAFASPPMGQGILSAAANNVLTAQGAVTETITGYFFGTEE